LPLIPDILATITCRLLLPAVRFSGGRHGATSAQQTVFLVVAADLGPVGAEIRRLITVELIVDTATVVLAAVGIAVVRANLRPLDDIEMTAGEIAKGRLDHRVPQRDPRTQVGSLGHSLNAARCPGRTGKRWLGWAAGGGEGLGLWRRCGVPG
jgi:HAMP domain-containing protein